MTQCDLSSSESASTESTDDVGSRLDGNVVFLFHPGYKLLYNEFAEGRITEQLRVPDARGIVDKYSYYRLNTFLSD